MKVENGRLYSVVTGLSFAEVVLAMEHSNVCSYVQDQVDAFLAETGLNQVAHVFMATHSIGGREWRIVDGRKPEFFLENTSNDFNPGGWYIFREEDVSFLRCVSATSGSALQAEKKEEGWQLTLELPFVEGKLYSGSYARAFCRATITEEEERLLDWEAANEKLLQEDYAQHEHDEVDDLHDFRPQELVDAAIASRELLEGRIWP